MCPSSEISTTPNAARSIDEDGLPLARFVHVERDGRAIADLFELEVPVERALPYVLRELRGTRIAGPETLGRALVAARRAPAPAFARLHARPRRRCPPLDAAAYALTPVDRPGRASCCRVYLAAFAPGHPDRHGAPEDAAAHLERHPGREARRLLPGSGLAIARRRGRRPRS